MSGSGAMTPKERTLAVANRRQPAVLASTFKGTPEVDRQMMDHFGVDDAEELIPILGVCHLHWPWHYVRPAGEEDVRVEDGVRYNFWGVGRREMSYGGGTYMEFVHNPLAGARSVADVESYHWPRLEDLDFSGVAAECDRYADYAMSMNDWSIFETCWAMRGFEQFLTDMIVDEKLARAIIEHVEQFCWRIIEKLWEVAGEKFDFFGSVDDFGSQQSLLISVEMWEKYFRGGYKRAYEFAHSHGLKTWMHCDGAVRPLFGRFIDIGLDIFDPLMPMIEEMNPYRVVPEFGRDLVFHGTIDTQHLMPFESERNVRREVRRQMDELWPGGGLYMAPSHCIQPGTPLANILAVYEELRR